MARVQNVLLHRLVCLALLVVLLVLAPAADATPPDQTWIAGLYDDADFDDVILFITNGFGAVQPGMVWTVRPTAPVVGLATMMGTGARPLLPLSSAFGRAPPLA